MPTPNEQKKLATSSVPQQSSDSVHAMLPAQRQQGVGAYYDAANRRAHEAHLKERERRRRRHGIVLTTLMAMTLTAGVVSGGFMLGWWSPSFLERDIKSTSGKCDNVGVVPPPKDVSVRVVNATGTAGLAADTAASMRGRRFTVGGVGEQPAQANPSGDVVISYHPDRAKTAAEVVAKHFTNPKLVPDDKLAETVIITLNATKPSFVSPDEAAQRVNTMIENGKRLQKLCLDGR